MINKRINMKKLIKLKILATITLASLIAISLLYSCNQKTQETITIGYLPSLAASPMYAAIAEGYFEDEGLKVDIQEVYSGPELINALQGKGVDIAFGIVPPLIMARSKDIKIQSICGASIDSKDIREHRIMLHPESEIKNAGDLKGKKIAVVAEGTSDYFGLVQYLEKNGLTINDVGIIKTPHPDMIFAIASKSVDAACGIEPFITIGELQGKVKVFDYYYPDEPTEIGTYLATEDFIKNNQEIVSRFIKAIEKGIDFANNHEELRTLLPTLELHNIKFKISPEAAEKVTIMGFNKSLTESGVKNIMDQLIRFGDLKRPINVENCIYQPAE
jgi:ABC-type nitrate/sulfonate/bicarbonate transport system substrate-binding protein